MPYVRIDPDIYLEHEGVRIYYAYVGGEPSPFKFWFTTDPNKADDGPSEWFDARMLAGRWEKTPNVAEWEEFWRCRFKTEDDAIEVLVRSAIERKSAALKNAAWR